MPPKKTIAATGTMPVVFIGHGSPENAIDDNRFTKEWERLARSLPRPTAILCVSAHWVTDGTFVSASEKPHTLHEFSGCSSEIFSFVYPAPGSPQLAKRIIEQVRTVAVLTDAIRGFDHGTWPVVARFFPKATIPVVQMSIDSAYSPKRHYQIGQELSRLRQEGVLIIGSGNVVHNLTTLRFDDRSFDWAIYFDAFVKECVETANYRSLIEFEKQPAARFAHPIVDHFLPLLYCAGTAGDDKAISFNEEFFAASIGMRSFVWGMD
jgi:4,5-DOPA dioxygenase extradiol